MTGLSKACMVAFVLSREHGALVPFYRDILGLELLMDDGFASVFTLPGGVLRLTTVADHKPSAHTVLGWTVADIVATVRALQAKGVTFERYPGFDQDADAIWHAPHGRAKVAWFLDPEGNNLSITQSE